ncbi:uncharacterized protein LOC129553161 [Moschus berezovskii]|uniref:uncharacterized protein LOC129553161 n=1 Tax=Moschus berezovskii TaxID=68408 RepID=UPI002443D9A5|nr:uncharacterized protein LOC129553161 [Moschus berezovskii]
MSQARICRISPRSAGGAPVALEHCGAFSPGPGFAVYAQQAPVLREKWALWFPAILPENRSSLQFDFYRLCTTFAAWDSEVQTWPAQQGHFRGCQTAGWVRGTLCDHGMHNAGRCQRKDPRVFTSLAPGSQMRDGPHPLRAGPVLTATTVIIPVLEGLPGTRVPGSISEGQPCFRKDGFVLLAFLVASAAELRMTLDSKDTSSL